MPPFSLWLRVLGGFALLLHRVWRLRAVFTSCVGMERREEGDEEGASFTTSYANLAKRDRAPTGL